MKKIFKSLCDYIFSFGMLMFLLATTAVFCFIMAAVVQTENDKKRQQLVEQCYSLNMVLVDADIGLRCVAIQNLVKVN